MSEIPLKCPHCGSENTRPHGKTTSGQPRRLCRERDCKKTFSLSGLPSGGQLKGKAVMSDKVRARLYRARNKALKEIQKTEENQDD
jgi:transposase-like protein